MPGRSKATRPTDPALEGYSFEGWYTDAACATAYGFENPVTADLTLYAKWTGASYVVEFVTDGGTEVDDQVVGGGGTATKPADPKKDGYTFSGWYTVSGDQASVFDFATLINADTVLYAHWTADKTPSHTVTFDANGGSPTPAAQTVEDGNTASEPSTAPTWDNGTFAGWYEQIELTDEEIAQIESDPSMSDIVWIDNGKAYVEYDFNDPVFEDG